MPYILFIIIFIFTAIIANEESLIIETENKTIEAILKADENIGTRSNKSLNKENISAVLCVVTNFILSEKKEVVDQPTEFNVTTYTAGPTKGLEGTITDNDGITSVEIKYKNAAGTVIYTSNYADGNINNEPTHDLGTTYTITVTDDNGVVKTKTGTL
jgi:hypothetical protein